MQFDRTKLARTLRKRKPEQQGFSLTQRLLAFETLKGFSEHLNFDEFVLELTYRTGTVAGYFINYGFDSALFSSSMKSLIPTMFIRDGDEFYTLQDSCDGQDIGVLCDTLLAEVLFELQG